MKIKIEENKDLKNLNTYKIRVKAKYFIELEIKKDYSDIKELFEFIKREKIKYFILGSGANIIFKTDFYDGIVIKIKNKKVSWIKNNIVEVGAGMIWDNFLKSLRLKAGRENKKGFYDIQSLSLIPGTVGAAVYGNIGAFGSEVKKYISEVEYFDVEKGEAFDMLWEDEKSFNFSYRNSTFKKNKDKFLILRVVFDFSQKFSQEIKKKYKKDEYFSLEHFSKKHNLGKITKKEIRKNIIKIRKNIYPDIQKFPNVGSTFKNTEITKTSLKRILKKYPDMPHWILENNKVKIPTAYIFDKVLGLNGKEFENIKIHESRPLFFMNKGGATGKEFFDLCQKIEKMAKKELDVDLEEEVVFVD